MFTELIGDAEVHCFKYPQSPLLLFIMLLGLPENSHAHGIVRAIVGRVIVKTPSSGEDPDF